MVRKRRRKSFWRWTIRYLKSGRKNRFFTSSIGRNKYVIFSGMEFDKKFGDDINYLVEGEKVWVQFWGEKILGVELPPSVILKVAETGPGEKGNSATSILKPATLESGLVVQVPAFIKEGEKLKINTQSGEYVSRA